jgi:hypothetical protein
MILNKKLSSTHSYSVSGSTIADRRAAYETNEKDDALEMFGPTTSLTIQADDEGNSGPAPISGPEVGDLTERSQLADPTSPLDMPEGLSYYIQAAQHNHRAFLTTNLCHADTAFVTTLSSTWLIGRSRNCAIVVHDRSISRCHAVVGYDVQQGFYLMDVGSSNGTYLNRMRLSVLKRYALADGDVITLCNLHLEFFIAA